jgi:NADH-quinone oxidoreductase subunit M
LKYHSSRCTSSSGIWGGENRLYAAIKFFLYTLVGSVVMLLGVLKMYFLTQDIALTSKIAPATLNLLAGNQEAASLVANSIQAAHNNGTGTFNILYMQSIGSVMDMGTMQVLLFAAFALGFAIKVPMFPFHTWLPDAHVEAPTAGSVILAGILLKLGTYGFYRFNLPMFPGASKDEHFFGSFGVRSVIVFLAIVSILYGALAAMYFVVKKDGDVKKLVALLICVVDGHGDAWTFCAQSKRCQRRSDADDQSRHLLWRVVPSGRHHL